MDLVVCLNNRLHSEPVLGICSDSYGSTHRATQSTTSCRKGGISMSCSHAILRAYSKVLTPLVLNFSASNIIFPTFNNCSLDSAKHSR
jgi:hypothetical protein